MKSIYSEIIQFRGTHYDFGYRQGKRLRNSFSVKNRENQWKVRLPRFTIKPDEVKQAIIAFAPGVWEELLGLQEALEWPIDRVLQEFGGYRLNYVHSGCSILTGSDYLIRFSDLYSSWAGTIHTSGYLPKERKAWFALGGDQHAVEFDFVHWLNGNDSKREKVTGEVDTDQPFLHMEKADWFQ